METLSAGSIYSCDFGDFDNDGDLDMIKGAASSGVSYVLWTQADGKLSNTGGLTINVNTVWDVTTGDYNGDGWTDFAMALRSSQRCSIFLNKGDGTFNSSPDIVTNVIGQWADSGDLNNDGVDDLIFGIGSGFNVFYGGETGPGTTADITCSVSTGGGGSIDDVDSDGYLDIIAWANPINIFLGGPDGPDTTPDHTFENKDNTGMGDVGDINGDGYIDIVVGTLQAKIRIFKGSASGWSTSDTHLFNMDGNGHPLVADIDKDGYDDIVVPDDTFKLGVYLGGASWPTTRDIVKPGTVTRASIAVPRGQAVGRAYRGTFTTELIERPAQDKKWDILSLEGSFPQNTSFEMDILDSSGKPIPGCSGIQDMNVDLYELLTDSYTSIKVQVTISSEFNTTTPVLNRLIVKWMDRNVWRDQFYGDARTERLMGLDIRGGTLQTDAAAWASPQLAFASLRNDTSYNVKSKAFTDIGGLNFLGRSPDDFNTKGAAALDVADVNGDGFLDVAFAHYQTSDTTHQTMSPLFLNSPTGWRQQPDFTFPTVGAADVLLEDLNGDGHYDVVFAQEQDNGDYSIDSILFWGSSSGWNATQLHNQGRGWC
jgi:hypothetical protein